MTDIAFIVPGEPQGKGRPRIGRVGAHARMFTPAKTAAYEGLVAMAAREAMAGAPLIDGPCALTLEVRHSMPKAFSRAKRALALSHQTWPTKKPDADNVLKAVCDGMNGVVWVDDVQAVTVSVSKVYAETPGVLVRVTRLTAA